ncbi:MAG: bifunctional phosphopantothenoylcysteine decarboxylase/phosphopantothenate--cysteine ligase CoaBC [Candidatus Hydrogenedentes bacterium]|nr:bifunctional phosphopantothenoylcysteine decarboxylase/phosphopantothenate--cysteine ligase CoaBC [Candidatus Hydrogenedentota bacterium]
MRRIWSDKCIVLGVTGSIAAYKACDLASRLVELGAEVVPVLTKSAREFVGAASFEAITGQRAITEMFEPVQNPAIEHIALATRASLFIIAPATANIIAKAAHGIADDWLSTTLLATRAPILFAPAMNSNMYSHPATIANIELLKSRGCHFVGPESGRLACKTIGPGRLIDVQAIIEAATPLVSGNHELAGKRVLITSGGTREPVDPVRFLGNRSSGRMGRALALAALARGAEVTVITGPAHVAPPYGARVVEVETAAEMAEAVAKHAPKADVVIAAAAVADYRVKAPSVQKRKRDGAPVTLDLIENPDILAALGKSRRKGRILVGFAAETERLLENARAKLQKKNLDLIVANQVSVADSGFEVDTVKGAILDRAGPNEEFPLCAKEEFAERLMERIVALANAESDSSGIGRANFVPGG